jgi:hypothetical protein
MIVMQWGNDSSILTKVKNYDFVPLPFWAYVTHNPSSYSP